MTIDGHIGVIEDLKSTMSVLMPEPEKTEICTSLSEAIDIMRRYQKIKHIINDVPYLDKDEYKIASIKEIINGNDDR